MNKKQNEILTFVFVIAHKLLTKMTKEETDYLRILTVSSTLTYSDALEFMMLQAGNNRCPTYTLIIHSDQKTAKGL